MDDHVCTPPAVRKIFEKWDCPECGARWEVVENFPNDVPHWWRVRPEVLLAREPERKTIDSARLVALLEERAEHYTAEFDRSKEEGADYAALSFGATALALREVAKAIFVVVGS